MSSNWVVYWERRCNKMEAGEKALLPMGQFCLLEVIGSLSGSQVHPSPCQHTAGNYNVHDFDHYDADWKSQSQSFRGWQNIGAAFFQYGTIITVPSLQRLKIMSERDPNPTLTSVPKPSRPAGTRLESHRTWTQAAHGGDARQQNRVEDVFCLREMSQ